MKKIFFSTVLLVLLSGCTQKVPISPIGGSKADGTIKLGYSYKMFEEPVVDLVAAKKLAVQKCKIWGYEGAEAFGGQTMTCSMPNMYGCEIKSVSIEYQCTGSNIHKN